MIRAVVKNPIPYAGFCARKLLVLLLTMVFLFAGAAPARAEALVADLSSHLIAITTGFQGSELLLFGATDGKGDVVVLVRGPEEPLKVRRKDRIGGIWVNREEVTFEKIPVFFRMASNRPVGDFVPYALLSRHQLGLPFLEILTAVESAPQAEIASFRAALIRGKIHEGFYAPGQGKVMFLGERLFRTNVVFPPNVRTGTYTIEVFLIHDGRVVGAQTTPLIVSKVGLGAEVFLFAHRHAALYGIFSVILAMLAGWLGMVLLRRV